ncbi:DUF1349 domain-containing protein [Bacteroides sp. 51]|uniref:DUF1349 domain-containing protein n=1 Tax=Bacteroides sp. 51 TaxID=2302938 RepID=UPI001EF1DCD4|nr:DUF1349 domain-containing protein [Bacteroides sp. 51]
MKKKPILIFTFCLLFLSQSVFAQQLVERVESIPYPLAVYNSPVGYLVEGNTIQLSAVGKTNLYNNPNGSPKVTNAPMILFEPEGDFTLSAKVSGNLQAIYDVAALVVYQDENTWAKFCYENSVKKQPTIVSVVTRTYSDDCNSVLTGGYAYMSIVKKGNQYTFNYSIDGREWDMIRSFNLATTGKIKVGFAAHGSRGDGFTGLFSEIKFEQ